MVNGIFCVSKEKASQVGSEDHCERSDKRRDNGIVCRECSYWWLGILEGEPG